MGPVCSSPGDQFAIIADVQIAYYHPLSLTHMKQVFLFPSSPGDGSTLSILRLWQVHLARVLPVCTIKDVYVSLALSLAPPVPGNCLSRDCGSGCAVNMSWRGYSTKSCRLGPRGACSPHEFRFLARLEGADECFPCLGARGRAPKPVVDVH